MKKILIVLTITLVTLAGGFALLALKTEKNIFTTPDINEIFTGDFLYVQKVGTEKIEGHTAIDTFNGKIYVFNNKRLLIIDSEGRLVEKISLAKMLQSKDSYVTSISFDRNKHLYLADLGAGMIYKVNIFAKNKIASRFKAKVKKPISVLAYKNRVYVFDAHDSKLKVFDEKGNKLAQHELIFKNKRSEFINDIDVIGNSGNLVLSDSNNGRILVFDLAKKKTVHEISGFTHPRGLDYVAGRKIVVADTFGSAVSLVDLDEGTVERLELPNQILEEGFYPFGVAYEKTTKTIVATDRVFGRIYFWRVF